MWALLAAWLVLQAHGRFEAPADPTAVATPPNAALILAERPVIEVVGVNGLAPPLDGVERVSAMWGRYLSGPVELVVGPAVTIQGAETRRIGDADVQAVLQRRTRRGMGAVTLIVWPRPSTWDTSGFYQRVWDGRAWVDVVVVHEPLPLPGFASDYLWEHVLLHELSHALHVPASPTHAWSQRHCTRAECVLYPRLDPRSFLETVRSAGRAWSLCELCSAEIDAVKAKR